MSSELRVPSETVRPAAWKRHVAILGVVQLGLGLIYLETVPRFYNDEPWEASLGYNLAYEGSLRHGIIEEWGGMHIHFVQNQVVQPFVLAAMYRLAGFSIFTSRLASLLVSVAAVLGVYGVMRHWLGSRAGLAIGLATIVHPWFFEIARRVRPDIYAIALAFAALLLYLRVTTGEGRRGAFMAGILSGLAGLAHPTGFVLVSAMAGGLAAWQRPTRFARIVIRVGAGFLIALLPYVVWVLWAVQHPEVDFFEQMRGGRAVGVSGFSKMLGVELFRWGHFFQWPIGAPLAAIMLAAWSTAWFRSTRVDKTIATTILLFAVAMPFTTVNSTSRYLIGLTPLFAALMVRMIDRVRTRHPSMKAVWHKSGVAVGAGIGGVYALICLAAIGVMLQRLRGADLTPVLERVAAVTGPDARIYGEAILWMGKDRFRYHVSRSPPTWIVSVRASIDSVRRHRFEYAVRPAWSFRASHGINRPPASMPAWRPDFIIDRVCEEFGMKIAEFRDPYFGPMEIYKLDWSEDQ